MNERLLHLQESIAFDHLMRWLDAPKSFETLVKSLQRRHKGTCKWVLQSEEFQQWKSGTTRCLWLHGIAGCGKTTLSSAIIDHLGDSCLYFFFQFDNVEKANFHAMVRALIQQLANKYSNVEHVLEPLAECRRTAHSLPTTGILLQTLEAMLIRAGEVYIVLDALDEIIDEAETQDIMSWVYELLRKRMIHVRVLLASRNLVEIRTKVDSIAEDIGVSTISINSSSIEKDILEFVQGTLKENAVFKKSNDHTWRDQKINELVGKAGGMLVSLPRFVVKSSS